MPPSPTDVLRNMPEPEDWSTTASSVICVIRRSLTPSRPSILIVIGFDTAISQRPSKQAPASVPSAVADPLVGEIVGDIEAGGCTDSGGAPASLALDDVREVDGSAPSPEPSSRPPFPPQPERTAIRASATAAPVRPLPVVMGQPLNSYACLRC